MIRPRCGYHWDTLHGGCQASRLALVRFTVGSRSNGGIPGDLMPSWPCILTIRWSEWCFRIGRWKIHKIPKWPDNSLPNMTSNSNLGLIAGRRPQRGMNFHRPAQHWTIVSNYRLHIFESGGFPLWWFFTSLWCRDGPFTNDLRWDKPGHSCSTDLRWNRWIFRVNI